MSLYRRAARRDTNHSAVVGELLRAGATVQAVSAPGAPDLLVGYRGINVLVEVKSEGAGLNALQRAWHASWRGAKPYVVWDAASVAGLLRDVLREAGEESA